jgi:glyoxylase-like metal-dependent hydrolase (beta-lactamase superfamily II)
MRRLSRPFALLSAVLALLAVASAGASAQDATPGAATPEATPAPPPDQVVQFAEDTYAFVSGGYVSLFIVTDEGVIATDPSSQFDEGRAERYAAAIASVTDQPVRYLVYSHDHADHATGGDVFADTATFVSHRNAVAKIAALADPRTPVPTIAFHDYLSLTLGGTTIELYYAGRNHSDNSIVLLHPERRLLFAVDFIPVDSILFRDLPDAYLDEWIASLTWVEENLDFDTLVIGHPPVSGTKADVAEIRGYIEDLIAAVEAAQAAGLADNSPEMVEAVRAELEPTYGTWANFEEWLPLNVEGVIRIRASEAATPGATPAS